MKCVICCKSILASETMCKPCKDKVASGKYCRVCGFLFTKGNPRSKYDKTTCAECFHRVNTPGDKWNTYEHPDPKQGILTVHPLIETLDPKIGERTATCIGCGEEITTGSTRCRRCNNKLSRSERRKKSKA